MMKIYLSFKEILSVDTNNRLSRTSDGWFYGQKITTTYEGPYISTESIFVSVDDYSQIIKLIKEKTPKDQSEHEWVADNEENYRDVSYSDFGLCDVLNQFVKDKYPLEFIPSNEEQPYLFKAELIATVLDDNTRWIEHARNEIYVRNMKDLITNGAATIPYGVTEIGDRAFEYCTELTSIEIPNSVVKIGTSAFHGCTKLTSIEIPNSVTEIGDRTFDYCTGLTSIEIPNSVVKIGTSAFRGCTKLTNIEIPNSMTKIGDGIFRHCSSLTSIEIPSSVIEIGNNAFRNCSSLASIEIPSSVIEIGNNAFRNCSSLTSIKIPSSVIKIGYGVVAECANMTHLHVDERNPCFMSINDALLTKEGKILIGIIIEGSNVFNIPNSVTKIEKYTFCNCSNLSTIEIPNSVTEIGGGAFTGCLSLTTIKIPNSVTIIGASAFSGCSNLASIEIPNSVTEIGDGAFEGCTNLKLFIHTKYEAPQDSEKLINRMLEVSDDVTLYVPIGCGYAYRHFTFKKPFMDVKIDTGVYGIKHTEIPVNAQVQTPNNRPGQFYASSNHSSRPRRNSWLTNTAFEGDPEAGWNID